MVMRETRWIFYANEKKEEKKFDQEIYLFMLMPDKSFHNEIIVSTIATSEFWQE